MSRTAKILVWIAGGLVVLLLISGLLVRSLLTDSTKQKVLAKISSVIGVPVRVGGIAVDFGEWMKLQPVLKLTNVTIGNPPGFRSPEMARAESLLARVSLSSLTSANPDIQRVEIVHPVITLERSADGSTNLQTFLKNLSAKSSAQTTAKQSDTSILIDSLTITGGEVRLVGFASAGGDVPVLRNIHYELTGFGQGRALQNKIEAGLYQAKLSSLRFDGTIGPITANSLPSQGKLNLKIAPSDVPKSVVAALAGSMLSNPAQDGTVEIDATLKGDVYATASGPMTLIVSKLMIGPDPKKTLPLSGKANGQFSLTNPLANLAWSIALPDAALQLGKGQWKAKVDAATTADQMLTASSAGSIRGIDIQEFLGAMTSLTTHISGQLSIPRYTLRTSGKNPDQMLAGLTADGDMAVANGRLDALDLIGNIKNAIDNPKLGAQQGSGNTEFANLTSHWTIRNQTIQFSDFAMDSPSLRVHGAGTTTFAQMVNFQMDAQVNGRLAELMGKSANEYATIPVNITGPSSKPTVKPNVSRMAIDTGMNYLNKFLGGKLGQKK
jgi:uncharacterized protein involved in outer membrane biogenesis